MKITKIKSFVGSSGYFFVKVETDAGIYGLGEGGLRRRALALAEVIRSFEPFLIGADPFQIEHLWQVMFRGGFFPGGVVQSAAVSAVDIALWDIKGKALNVPVYELLGGRTRDKVVCYPHNGGGTIDALVESCRQTHEAGWKFVRWGLADGADKGTFEPPLGPVSTAACLHLCLASSLVGVQELPRAPMSSLADEFPVQVPFESGYLLPPSAPGLGIEFDEAALATVSTQDYGPPTGYLRDDGSYTNW